MSAKKAKPTARGTPQGKKTRSPNHPLVSLPKAIERVGQLFRKYSSHDVPLEPLHGLWGYKAGSAAGDQCVAALNSYGLIRVTGKGKSRRVTISEAGERIIRNAPDRATLIQTAALRPRIHQEVWGHYEGKQLPPDDLFRQYLVWDRPKGKRFNEDVVGNFIARFRESLEFAGLSTDHVNDKIEENGDTEDRDEPPVDPPQVAVGNFVQWTSGGADQFPEPRRVIGLSEDGQWAFVDGNPTGLPMNELTTVPTPAPTTSAQATPPANPFSRVQHPGVATERMALNEGPVELTMPEKLEPESVSDFRQWLEDLPSRAHRRSGGANRSLPLPSGGTLHLISYPGSNKWQIRSYDFSWFAGLHLMTATVHAEPNGWGSIEFDSPEDAITFVEEKPRPGIVPQHAS